MLAEKRAESPNPCSLQHCSSESWTHSSTGFVIYLAIFTEPFTPLRSMAISGVLWVASCGLPPANQTSLKLKLCLRVFSKDSSIWWLPALPSGLDESSDRFLRLTPLQVRLFYHKPVPLAFVTFELAFPALLDRVNFKFPSVSRSRYRFAIFTTGSRVTDELFRPEVSGFWVFIYPKIFFLT